MAQHYKIIKKEENKEAEIELTVEVSTEFVSSFDEKVLAEFVKEAEIEGFRKGKAPADMVKAKIGDLALSQESTQRAVQELIPIILAEEKLDAITMPHVHLTKLAPGNPIEFMMHFYVMPEVELADYKALAKSIKKETSQLKDEEVTGYIDQILNSRATKNEAGETVKPELDDEFVKSIGEFKDVADFKAKLSENMAKDKETQASQKRRLEIIEKIITETKFKLPEVLVEEEQQKMLDEFRGRVESMKMNFDEYLATIKKTGEELMAEWKEDATKRAKMNIVLPQIANKESIKPDVDVIDKEIAHLKEHYKDLDEHRARVYVAGILTNEEVFKFLETL